jgi:hypothetical protein
MGQTCAAAVAKSGREAVTVTRDPRRVSAGDDERFSRNPGSGVTHDPSPQATD